MIIPEPIPSPAAETARAISYAMPQSASLAYRSSRMIGGKT